MEIIMTIGPASENREVLAGLLKTATGFRLNSSFLDHHTILEKIDLIQDVFDREKKVIPIIIDLQGAKMRIGSIKPKSRLDNMVYLVPGSATGEENCIPIPHEELFRECRAGDILTLNDNRIRLKITKAAEDRIAAEVVVNGPLSSFKGINRDLHPIPFNKLSDKDQLIINAVKEFPFVQFAFSFVHTGSEAGFVKKLSSKPVTAKIERPESFPYLEEISRMFDGLWFCRGDLGAQAGILNLPGLQHNFAVQIAGLKVKALLAGQVLEYMTHFPQPTRSEVVHLYDSIKQGFYGIVLSDETAIGKNPLKVAEFLETIQKSWE